MLYRTVVVAGIVVAAGSGCVKTVMMDGFEVSEAGAHEAIEKVKTRAAFELECPKEKLQTRLLDVYYDWPKQIGVTGCGHRVVYVRPDGSKQWILNSDSAEGKPAQAQEP